MTDLALPFNLETELERRIADDPAWREGVEWGRPRHGHTEGTIKAHVAAVLDNADRFYGDNPFREKLRLIALIHDTFKYQVDMDRPRAGQPGQPAVRWPAKSAIRSARSENRVRQPARDSADTLLGFPLYRRR